MSGFTPAAVFGLEVRPGDAMVPAVAEFPASFRITMAAIDPSAQPIHSADMPLGAPARATLKMVRTLSDDDDTSYTEDDDEDIRALMDDESQDEGESDSNDERNGGPSDPAKSKKAKRDAAVQALKDALANDDDDEDTDERLNHAVSTKLKKGKGIATGNESDEGDLEEDDENEDEFILCTLDTMKLYQQPLDITVMEHESIYFRAIGTHTIYLTGNFIVPPEDFETRLAHDGDDYDLSPDEDELYEDDEEDSDALDSVADPRIVELQSEQEADEVPKLVKTVVRESRKRSADADLEDGPSLDEIMAKGTQNKPQLPNKKQQKKLKNNAGEAVDPPLSKVDVRKNDKKVQFAKNLEQGPTPSSSKDKKNGEDTVGQRKSIGLMDEKREGKATLGVKTIQGVRVDDRKLGSGPAAKKGSKVGMRYIGKLEDGQVFDSNKKGTPFKFTLGAGEVIKGWDIGVEGMSVGGERRITVPANLAYGKKTLPGIPKNSILTFDLKIVELR